jgi:tetratricopeptide (TPR) repeat protein
MARRKKQKNRSTSSAEDSDAAQGERDAAKDNPASFLSNRPLLVLVLALAAIFRATYFVAYLKSPLAGYNRADHAYYRNWALSIANGDWIGTETFEQAPLYPYLLGLIYQLVGANDHFVMIAQMLIGTTLCMLGYACARRLYDDRTALTAAMITALYGPLVFYECMVMKSFLSPCLTMLALYCGLCYADARKVVWMVAAGASVGLACLVRENHLLLLVPSALWIVYQGRLAGTRWLLRLFHLLALGGALVLMLVPSTVRNYYVTQQFVVVTAGGGEVFYMGHGPTANGYYNPPPFITANPNHEHEDFRQEARRRTGLELTRAESSRYWFREAKREVLRHPGRAITVTVAKLSALFNDFEVPDSHYYAVTRDYLSFLKILPSFGWISGFGFLGLALCLRDFKRFQLPILFVAAHTLSVVLTYNFGRFRIGMTPVWILLAAHGLLWLVDAWRCDPAKGPPNRSRTWLATCAVVVLTVFAFLPPMNYQQTNYGVERPVFHYILAMRKEDYPLAERHIRQAIQVGNGNRKADAHHALGQLLQRTERPKEARKEYLAAIELNPNESQTHIDLGILVASTGDLDNALSHYTNALAIDPHDAEAHYNAGAALSHQKKFAEAVEHFRRAIELRPDSSAIHNSLAVVLNELGHANQASHHYRVALRLDPDNLEACFNYAMAMQKSNQMEGALQQFHKCLDIKPKFAPVHIQLAKLTFRMQRFAEAVSHFEAALTIQPNYADAPTLEMLAAAYAGDGRFSEATRTAEAALTMVRDISESPLSKRISEALSRYRSGEP